MLTMFKGIKMSLLDKYQQNLFGVNSNSSLSNNDLLSKYSNSINNKNNSSVFGSLETNINFYNIRAQNQSHMSVIDKESLKMTGTVLLQVVYNY